MRLNLGCGDRYVNGWINVDLPDMPHYADQRVDLTGQLPWPAHSLSHIYAGHVLEHLELGQAFSLVKRLLPLTQHNGVIMLVGPDIDLAEKMIAAGAGLAEMYGATLDSLKYGAGRWSGDVHHWECRQSILEDMLRDAGWSDIVSMDIWEAAHDWPVADPRPRWQCAVTATAHQLSVGERT